MTVVKSTYNFVPAPKEDEVFYPDWADQVSHDIPFSDGESGEIEFTITAESPIFIRNGHSEKDSKAYEEYIVNKVDNPSYKPSEEDKARIERYLSFSNINGKYFIPATSIKGMIRNVLEIMSFGQLNTHDDIFAFRNLNHDEYKKAVLTNKNIKAGWLYKDKDKDKWIITECWHKKVPIRSIEEKFNVEIKGKSAVEKYSALDEPYKADRFKFEKNLGFKVKDKFIKTAELFDFSSMNDNNATTGTIVLFGPMNNKKYEYIFGPGNDNHNTVSNDLMERFLDIEKKSEESLFNYLYKAEKKKKIPVFYSAKNGYVEHFGFSRLYKLPNVKRIKELSPVSGYSNNRFDLAQSIFGSTLPTSRIQNTGVKGRVFFGHSICKSNIVSSGEPVKAILSTPKASYFPFYLKNGNTYLNLSSELSGFKRYPIHNTIKTSKINEDNKKIQTQFKPLSKGTRFSGKIRFHNLKKVEIGALLSSMTFHGNNNRFCHSLGAAKSLGYGKVKIEINNLKDLNFEKGEYLMEFEKTMCNHIENWLYSKPMESLFAVAQCRISEKINNSLVYPELEPENEFLEYELLPPYYPYSPKVESLVAKFNKHIREVKKKEKEIREKKEQEEINNIAQELIQSDDIKTIRRFIQDHPDNDYIPMLTERIKEIEAESIKNKADNYENKDLSRKANPDFEEYKQLLYKMSDNEEFKFSEDQLEQIENYLRDVWKNEEERNIYFMNGNRLIKYKKNPWKFIKSLIGPERAKALFNEFHNN